MSQPISVVEPQMDGFFHAPFNAALLHAVVLAYPQTSIAFSARRSHSDAVRQILNEFAAEIPLRISWDLLPDPRRRSTSSRWLYNRRVIRDLLNSSDRILLTSISRMQLGILKSLMRPRHLVRAVLHGDIDRLEHPPSEPFPASLFSLHRVLRRKHPAGLRYLLLGESIRRHIPPDFVSALADSAVIPHPYHFPPIHPPPPGPAVFGTFGNTGDALLLASVAGEIHRQNPSVDLRLVGFVRDQAAVNLLGRLVRDVGFHPIPRSVFLERAQNITHALWVAPPQTFRLRASGTFFDALAFGKPLVYVANPYIDNYFDQAPGIGVRCERIEDLPAAVLELAATHNPEAYARAQIEIAALRERFTPPAVASLLPDALGW